MPMQYTATFHGCKNDNFHMKNCDIFSYFCSKHRSWVHIQVVLTNAHNLCFREKIRKNMYYYIQVAWGAREYKSHRHVILKIISKFVRLCLLLSVKKTHASLAQRKCF